MRASVHVLSRQWKSAEQPLLQLFQSRTANQPQKAAAAYGLCGVYRKTGNTLEQLRYAFWLHHNLGQRGWSNATNSSDMSVYWASSGWDLKLLLDAEAPIETLRAFSDQNPHLRLIKYSLAVRLSLEHQYEEAARIYESINARHRVPRMRKLAELFAAANQPGPVQLEARYAIADYLSHHSTQIYFNDALWFGFQRYALFAEQDVRLTRAEHDALVKLERHLKDTQEEYWQAYLLCRQIVGQAPGTDLARRAAKLGVSCLRRIRTDRFGRESEIRAADLALSTSTPAASTLPISDMTIR